MEFKRNEQLEKFMYIKDNLNKLFLLEEAPQVPQLKDWYPCADSKRHDAASCDSSICYFIDFPHLCFPVFRNYIFNLIKSINGHMHSPQLELSWLGTGMSVRMNEFESSM